MAQRQRETSSLLLLSIIFTSTLLLHASRSLSTTPSGCTQEAWVKNMTTLRKFSVGGARGGSVGGGGHGGGRGGSFSGDGGAAEGSSGGGGGSKSPLGKTIPIVGGVAAIPKTTGGGGARRHNAAITSCSHTLVFTLATTSLAAATLASL